MIKNITRNHVLAHNVQIAQTPLARMKGLIGASSLLADSALVIIPCNSVHMLFMRFAIDVVFVDKANTVVGICVNLKPFQLSPLFFKAHKAIELPVGTIAKTQTAVGDTIGL